MRHCLAKSDGCELKTVSFGNSDGARMKTVRLGADLALCRRSETEVGTKAAPDAWRDLVRRPPAASQPAAAAGQHADQSASQPPTYLASQPSSSAGWPAGQPS